jgi:hypothetical protein
VAPPPPPPPPAAPDPSPQNGCRNADECAQRLKALVDSPDRSWIGQAQSPAAYADGTRLFAYRALRAQLTCPELARALDEIGIAAGLASSAVPGFTQAQLAQVLRLGGEVESELKTERNARCG